MKRLYTSRKGFTSFSPHTQGGRVYSAADHCSGFRIVLGNRFYGPDHP